MSEALENLNENLKRQVELYEELLTLEGNKRNALVKNNLQEIESITAQEELFVMKVNRLEKERLLCAEQIGLELGKPPEDLTLAELAEHFPVLEEVRLDLDTIVGRLQEIHEINSQLLEKAMKIVDFTVGLLTHQQDTTYTHPARKVRDGNGKRRLLDQSV